MTTRKSLLTVNFSDLQSNSFGDNNLYKGYFLLHELFKKQQHFSDSKKNIGIEVSYTPVPYSEKLLRSITFNACMDFTAISRINTPKIIL